MEEIHEIRKRLASVESQYRRLRAACGVVMSVIVAGLLMGQSKVGSAGDSIKSVVEAERFVLKDNKGKIRGEWAIQDNSVKLRLFDESEQAASTWEVTPKGDVDLLIGNQEKKKNGRMLSLVNHDKGPYGLVLDKNDMTRALVTIGGENEDVGIVAVFGIPPTGVRMLAASEHHEFVIDDPKTKKPRISSIVGSDEYANIVISDQKGVERAMLGNAFLTGSGGSKIVRPESSLVLFDEAGSVILKAP